MLVVDVIVECKSVRCRNGLLNAYLNIVVIHILFILASKSLQSASYVKEYHIKYGLKVTSRDPNHQKSIGCRFLVVVLLIIDLHRFDHRRTQGSYSGVPKGTNLEVRYQCAHRKFNFQEWKESA